MSSEGGHFVITYRMRLTEEQRDRLERLRRKRDVELDDLLSEIVGHYLDEVAEEELAEPFVRDERAMLEERLRSYQRDLRRLRMRQHQLRGAEPPWLASYITDVEAEIASLQRRLSDEG